MCNLIKSFYSLYYAEACNKLAEPISASLRPDNTAFFEEMKQRRRAVGNTMFDLNLRPPAPETNEFPLEQLAAVANLTNQQFWFKVRHRQVPI